MIIGHILLFHIYRGAVCIGLVSCLMSCAANKRCTVQYEDITWIYADSGRSYVTFNRIGDSIFVYQPNRNKVDSQKLTVRNSKLSSCNATATFISVPYSYDYEGASDAFSRESIVLDSGASGALGRTTAHPLFLPECAIYHDVFLIQKAPEWRGGSYQYSVQFSDTSGNCYRFDFDPTLDPWGQDILYYGRQYLLLSSVVRLKEDSFMGLLGYVDLGSIVEKCREWNNCDPTEKIEGNSL